MFSTQSGKDFLNSDEIVSPRCPITMKIIENDDGKHSIPDTDSFVIHTLIINIVY